MILQPVHTKQFERDIKKMKKSGKDFTVFKRIYQKLLKKIPLEPRYKDHKLKGNFKDRRECHIEPNWILIYKINIQDNTIIYERTGTHSDLFEKKKK